MLLAGIQFLSIDFVSIDSAEIDLVVFDLATIDFAVVDAKRKMPADGQAAWIKLMDSNCLRHVFCVKLPASNRPNRASEGAPVGFGLKIWGR